MFLVQLVHLFMGDGWSVLLFPPLFAPLRFVRRVEECGWSSHEDLDKLGACCLPQRVEVG